MEVILTVSRDEALFDRTKKLFDTSEKSTRTGTADLSPMQSALV
jgi:hypothetical protein